MDFIGGLSERGESEQDPENPLYGEKDIRNARNVGEKTNSDSVSGASDVLDNENKLSEKVRWITSVELEEHIHQNQIKHIFIDTETTGLNPLSDDLLLILGRILSDPEG